MINIEKLIRNLTIKNLNEKVYIKELRGINYYTKLCDIEIKNVNTIHNN